MKLMEYEGKKIFSDYGILVPKGFVVTDVGAIRLSDIKGNVMLKAQVPFAGRKKQGLILKADKKTIKKRLSSLLKTANVVLVEEKLNVKKEYYLAVTLDREKGEFVLLYSEDGGIDIEDAKVKRLRFGKSVGNAKIDKIAQALWQITKDFDALLVEINPLALVGNEYVALDAKILLDDAALFRHPEVRKEDPTLTAIEKKAKDFGLQYIELQGDIAVIGNGAGLVMATLDCLHWYGCKPANFLDIGGGANMITMERAMEIALMKKPKLLLINIFAGITRCDEIAQGIINYKKRKLLTIPIIVRMIGTNEEEGRRLLTESGIATLDSMEECARQAAAYTK